MDLSASDNIAAETQVQIPLETIFCSRIFIMHIICGLILENLHLYTFLDFEKYRFKIFKVRIIAFLF